MPSTDFDNFQGLFNGAKVFEEDSESLSKGLIRGGLLDRLESLVQFIPDNDQADYINALRSNSTNPSVLLRSSQIGQTQYLSEFENFGKNNLLGIVASTPLDFLKYAMILNKPTNKSLPPQYADVGKDHLMAFNLREYLNFYEKERKSGKISQNGNVALNNIKGIVSNYYKTKYTGKQEIVGKFFVEATLHGANDAFPLSRADRLSSDLVDSIHKKLDKDFPHYMSVAYVSEKDKIEMYTRTLNTIYEESKQRQA
ncbi:MAG: hypothetical protein WC867_07945 [Candidatus Pacearchaeota archaeon]|jgi:hypothetical protein